MSAPGDDPAPLWALLPVKGFGRAKSRLSPILGGAERAELARRLCEHVLAAINRCPEIAGVLVLSDSEEVLQLLHRRGVCAERELAERSRTGQAALAPLAAIIDDGLSRLQQLGARSALVLMADLPLLVPGDLAEVTALLHQHDGVIVPDLREENTNALALRLGRHPQTAFGTGDSFRRHQQLFADAGQRAVVHRSPGLGFDVDLPGDYEQLSGALGT